MVTIKCITVNPFAENTYVLHDETGEAVVIDPGCYEPFEQELIDKYIAEHSLKVVKLLNTHCHIDHVLGNHYIKTKYQVPLVIHRLDLPVLKSVTTYAGNYGFPGYEDAEPDSFVEEGDKVEFGDSILDVVFVPGHAPGHVAFFNVGEKFCIGGDVLFDGSIGRTDLPGGHHDTLIESIKTKFFAWDDDMVVHCGHGPSTTIGKEKRTNPFCAIL